MLLKTGQREVLSICLLLGISCTSALARVDNNWSQRRPNITVTQNQRGQAGYRPANVGYQQPLVHNQTHGYSYNNQHQQWQQQQQNNNRTQYNQPVYRPAINNPAQVNNCRPQQIPSYGQGTFNQTRPAVNQSQYPAWPQQRPLPPNSPQYIAYGQQNTLNHTRPLQPNSPQYPAYGHQNTLNHTRPLPPSFPQNPAYGQQNTLNHTRPLQPNYPQNPGYVPQNTLNHTRPSYPQPSAPQVPVYPALPNNKPAIPSNTWTPAANQTLIYPPLPNKDLPSAPPTVGINGIPLAPLQPAPQGTQGPQNWHSGGQAVLSYGPGHYPSPAGNTNKNPPTHQGSSNPYANMFN